MNQSGERRIVLSAPGFPVSDADHDKPFLLNHAKALSAAGFHVTVVCPALPNLAGRQTVEGIEVIRVRYAPRRLETLAATGSMYEQAKGIRFLLAFPMLVSMIYATIRELRTGAAIAYGHWWVPGGLVAVIAGWCCRRPSVVHLHGSDVAIAANKFTRQLARWVLRRATVRLAVSEELAQWGCHLSSRSVRVLPMPLAFGPLSQPSPSPENGFLLAVGRLVPEKGFSVLIAAVALMGLDERPDLVIVGTGPEREKLLAQAARSKVSLRLPGAVAPTELLSWYQRARIVAVPSLREGFGLVAAEAAAAGRVVVGSAVGGISDVVNHGSSGMLVKPGNIEELALALQSVDPQWGANGPERVAHLGMSSHAQILKRLFDGLPN